MNTSPIRSMSRAQVERFLGVITDPRDRAIFELIYRYGLRVSEVVLISMEDVDLDNRTIRIQRVARGIGKTCFLAEDTSDILKAYLRVRKPMGDQLFTGREGGLKDKRIGQLFRKYGEMVDIVPKGAVRPKYTVHTLRNAIGYHMLIDGHSAEEVQEHLGHRDSSTVKVYIRGLRRINMSPALGPDGTLYSGSWNDRLYALSPDGQVKWTHQAKAPVSTPVVGPDGTVYVGSWDCRVYAFAPDGTLKWSYATGRPVRSAGCVGPSGSLYIPSEDYFLYAFSPDGSLRWRYKTGWSSQRPPGIDRDETLYLGARDGILYAINPDGTTRWTFDTGDRLKHQITCTPAIGDDGVVYFGCPDHYVYALEPDGGLRWRYKTDASIFASPTLRPDGRLYIGSIDGCLHALDPDGRLIWRYRTGGEIHSTPVVGADGTIYVGCLDQFLYALDADGRLQWRFSVGGKVYAAPTPGPDGTLYVASLSGQLYAIRAVLVWEMFEGTQDTGSES